jgi:hypothetical protein
MPDPQDNPQPVQQQGGMINGGQVGISGGTNFFGNLVQTLVRGAVQGGVAALGQNQSNPYTRSMAAGINAPRVQQQQQDENTERQMRMALTKVQYLQAVHALRNTDEQTQTEAHDRMRDYIGGLEKNHQVEWLGGTSPDRNALVQDASKYGQQYKNDQVLIVPTGYSTHGSPTWGIAHIKSDPLAETANFQFGGHDDSGLPPKTINAPRGTPANESAGLVIGDMRKSLVASEVSKQNGPVPSALPQTTPDELRQEMQARRIPIPANLDELYDVNNGAKKYSDLPKTSSWEGASPIIGQDRASQFVKHNFDPTFEPNRSETQGEMREVLEGYLKPGGMKDDKVDEAGETADAVLNDKSSSTAEKQIARQVKAAAVDSMAKNPMSKGEFDSAVGKVVGEKLIGPNDIDDSKKVAAGIEKSSVLSPVEKQKAIAHLISTPTPASQGTAMKIRVEGMLQARENPVINTQSGALELRDSEWVNSHPGLYSPAGPGMTAANKEAVFYDLHQNIDKNRDAFAALGKLDYPTRVQLAIALRSTDSKSAVSQLITSGAIGDDPKVQDLIVSMASMKENAMLLRSMGMGQGSDELRDAIQAIVPSGRTPSVGFANKQLDQFESIVNRLEKGVPRSGMPGLHISPRVQKALTALGKTPNMTRDQQVGFINSSAALTADEKKEALKELNGPSAGR